ncbi:MAG: hypothetical protein ABJM29_19880 [Rhizobiaceae bacterium]
MLDQFTPNNIKHFQPAPNPGGHRAFCVVLLGMLVVQLITVLVVLEGRSDRLEKQRIIVEDCQLGPESPPTFSRQPNGECVPLPIRLPIKV